MIIIPLVFNWSLVYSVTKISFEIGRINQADEPFYNVEIDLREYLPLKEAPYSNDYLMRLLNATVDVRSIFLSDNFTTYKNIFI